MNLIPSGITHAAPDYHFAVKMHSNKTRGDATVVLQPSQWDILVKHGSFSMHSNWRASTVKAQDLCFLTDKCKAHHPLQPISMKEMCWAAELIQNVHNNLTRLYNAAFDFDGPNEKKIKKIVRKALVHLQSCYPKLFECPIGSCRQRRSQDPSFYKCQLFPGQRLPSFHGLEGESIHNHKMPRPLFHVIEMFQSMGMDIHEKDASLGYSWRYSFASSNTGPCKKLDGKTLLMICSGEEYQKQFSRWFSCQTIKRREQAAPSYTLSSNQIDDQEEKEKKEPWAFSNKEKENTKEITPSDQAMCIKGIGNTVYTQLMIKQLCHVIIINNTLFENASETVPLYLMEDVKKMLCQAIGLLQSYEHANKEKDPFNKDGTFF